MDAAATALDLAALRTTRWRCWQRPGGRISSSNRIVPRRCGGGAAGRRAAAVPAVPRIRPGAGTAGVAGAGQQAGRAEHARTPAASARRWQPARTLPRCVAPVPPSAAPAAPRPAAAGRAGAGLAGAGARRWPGFAMLAWWHCGSRISPIGTPRSWAIGQATWPDAPATCARPSGGAPLAEATAAYEAVYARSQKQPEPFPGFTAALLPQAAAEAFAGLRALAGRDLLAAPTRMASPGTPPPCWTAVILTWAVPPARRWPPATPGTQRSQGWTRC